ncbi:MAG TPA: hypothetical protein VJ385_13205, partial [Fibrobacteria bacterium]|nr:hypothetical protein [Fibrobacteria bacterium]
MTNRDRSGHILQAAWVATLLVAYPYAGETGSAGSQGVREIREEAAVNADANALFQNIKPVLAHSYAGIDTAALLARVQERQQWGEKDERLIEAEGILHWDRGDMHLAMPCFKRLTHPGSLSMGFLAEGLLAKGERYEAAGWFLKAARAADPGDPAA